MNKNLARYQRQIILKGFGEAAQQKLLHSKVLVAGAGGLGCPVLLYLAAAGVATIGIADDDVVSLTNLHRQILYNEDDIGKLKVEIAKQKLHRQNPTINIISHQTRLTNLNVLEIINQYDVIIDGTDNFSAKYILNDACVLLDKPLVYGAVSKFEGQVAVFNFRENEFEHPLNYRDLFPEPSKNHEVQNCEEAGVLGVLAGIAGSMQASEAIKIITGVGNVLKNKLLTFDILTNCFYEVDLCKNKMAEKFLPENKEEFLNRNYELLCEANSTVQSVDATAFKKMLAENNSLFIDVREANEWPPVNFSHIKIPLSNFENEIKKIIANRIVLFCQTGIRSLKAAEMLAKVNSVGNIFYLKDNINAVLNL